MTRRSPEIKPRVAHLEGQRQASSSFFRGSSGLLDFGGDAEPSSAGSSFAVHGLSDPQFPDRAALVLGRDPNASDDGLLVAVIPAQAGIHFKRSLSFPYRPTS